MHVVDTVAANQKRGNIKLGKRSRDFPTICLVEPIPKSGRGEKSSAHSVSSQVA